MRLESNRPPHACPHGRRRGHAGRCGGTVAPAPNQSQLITPAQRCTERCLAQCRLTSSLPRCCNQQIHRWARAAGQVWHVVSAENQGQMKAPPAFWASTSAPEISDLAQNQMGITFSTTAPHWETEHPSLEIQNTSTPMLIHVALSDLLKPSCIYCWEITDSGHSRTYSLCCCSTWPKNTLSKWLCPFCPWTNSSRLRVALGVSWNTKKTPEVTRAGTHPAASHQQT